jgi:23S rRNA (uracil1939-C5)-methyltransferase
MAEERRARYDDVQEPIRRNETRTRVMDRREPVETMSGADGPATGSFGAGGPSPGGPVTADLATGESAARGPERITGLHIDAMSHGAAAVARYRGRVLFVAGGAPGDVADVVVTETRARFMRARIERLAQPSPARRDPPCPWVGRCGGCQWQHLEYAAQLAAKRRNLIENLTRIGGLPADTVREILPAPSEWRYRHRINLRTDGGRLGFYRAESHEIIEIDDCAIAAEPLGKALGAARAWLAQLRTTIRRLALVHSETTPGLVFVANAEGELAAADDAINRQLVGDGVCRGVVMFGRGWRRSWGEPTVGFTCEGATLTTTGGEFTQVNFAANRLLVATVIALAGIRAGDEVLDLYCGAGNLGIPAARAGARVLGVERVPRAVADAVANVERLGLAACRFECAPAEAVLRRCVEAGRRVDVVLLDPPRGGARGILGDLVRLAPPRIVYVSCDPPAFARDAAILAGHGYRLTAVQPIDLFPQTYHLEIVAVLDAG